MARHFRDIAGRVNQRLAGWRMRSGWWSPASASKSNNSYRWLTRASPGRDLYENLNAVVGRSPRRTTTPWRGHSNTSTAYSSPPASGVWRRWAVQPLAGMPGLGGQPQVAKKALLVMCADHGVWDEGVAISPKAVTAIQAANMTRGTTRVCVLAAQAGRSACNPCRYR
ncbi:nicotinate-nucleotide--dimethylbenzimidazole phosphoribosyltransferase [Klebsiella pneumoniae]